MATALGRVFTAGFSGSASRLGAVSVSVLGAHVCAQDPAGSLGLGIVESGAIAKGTVVVPARPGLGLVGQESVSVDQKDVIEIGTGSVSVEAMAAGLSWGPITAMKLLGDLSAGQSVVVNAGGVGAVAGLPEAVVQIAKKKGLKSLVLVGDRAPKSAAVVERLKAMGGDVVVDAAFASTSDMQKVMSDFPAPSIAIDAEGGQSATEMARMLVEKGTMFTVAGAFGRPVSVPAGALITKGINVRGFSLEKWMTESGAGEATPVIQQVAQMVKAGELAPWARKMKLSQLKEATKASVAPDNDRAIVVVTPAGERITQ